MNTRILFLIGLTILFCQLLQAQTSTYQLVLKNDTLVSSTVYEFDIIVQRTGTTALELASLQSILTFNTGISGGTLTISMNSGSSQLNTSQQPTTMSVSGNELRINPRVPPGAGSGTIVPVAPGIRVGRFRLTSSVVFTNQRANVAWKNSSNPYTKVFAYVSSLNTEITDSTQHLNTLRNPRLSPPVITTASPLPTGTAGTAYSQTFAATGGTAPYTWSVASGTLPTGLTLSSAGLLSGTPTSASTFNFTVRVIDANPDTGTKAMALTINPGSLSNFLVEASSGGNIPTQTAGQAFTIRVTARDGSGNTVTSFAGTVNITSNGTLSSGSGTTAAFSGGVLASHSVTFAAGGTTMTITATNTAGAQTGTSNTFTVNFPAPTTTSISPTNKTKGDTAFTLTVNGMNFFSGSTIYYNGTSRTTTFVSSTQLRASILASDLNAAGSYPVTVVNPTPGGGTSNAQTFTVQNPVVSVKVFMEGPFSGTAMSTALRSAGAIPLAQPYNAAPWNYTGSENVATIPASVVDWVVIELRTGTAGSTKVTTRAAFIKSDGIVVDTNGTSPVTVAGASLGNYYVVVRHRNHLGVMSAAPVALSATSSLYDFTTGTGQYYGTEAKNLGGGRFGMFAGDYLVDGFIDGSDFTGPDNELFQNGYRRSDLNMDGFVDATDFTFPDNNVFKGTKVPN